MTTSSDISLVIHGGAGRDIRAGAEFDTGLADALRAGYAVLTGGGTSLDAVVAAVCALEDNPLFNAGRGASLAFSGRAELDSSVMDGATGGAGAVAGVTTVRNPVTLARAVMGHSPHVLLVGDGAEAFADTRPEIVRVPNDYFVTDARRKQIEQIIASGGPAVSTAAAPDLRQNGPDSEANPEKYGTVGAVARDTHGNLAAATSTGGMAGKRFGRVGDSPLIGAGTWAENATCAVSCTGHGEYFIRQAVAYQIAARMRFGGDTLETAAHDTLAHLTETGGEGGFIALDRGGNAVLPFNTPGMYQGYVTRAGDIFTGTGGAMTR